MSSPTSLPSAAGTAQTVPPQTGYRGVALVQLTNRSNGGPTYVARDHVAFIRSATGHGSEIALAQTQWAEGQTRVIHVTEDPETVAAAIRAPLITLTIALSGETVRVAARAIANVELDADAGTTTVTVCVNTNGGASDAWNVAEHPDRIAEMMDSALALASAPSTPAAADSSTAQPPPPTN